VPVRHVSQLVMASRTTGAGHQRKAGYRDDHMPRYQQGDCEYQGRDRLDQEEHIERLDVPVGHVPQMQVDELSASSRQAFRDRRRRST
jgi:hypothetical protein